jgi:penicillin amidase
MSFLTFLKKLPRRFTIAILAAAGITAIFSRPAAAAIVGCALIVIGGFYLFLRLSLPKVRGTIQMEGLKSQVEILRDSDSVPHIYGHDQLDCYFGLGYVHAQDRLWQMDFQRRLGQGRLAEIMGRGGLPFDRLARTLGFYSTAKRSWELLDPATRETVAAYVAGVNSFIASRNKAQLPPEFTLMRATPELWSGADVVLMSILMAWNLSGNYVTELLRERLVRAVGPERALEFMSPYVPARKIPVAAPKAVSRQLPEMLNAADAEDSRAIGEGVGSNMWMVSEEKCETGGPVLANDPHLPSTNPMTWYLAHLSAPGLDVIGATTPGIPGVIIGRNNFIAWGMTNLNPDVQDFFRERLDESGKNCEFQGKVEPVQVREEIIRVKNCPDVKLQVSSTRHGPIINDVIGGDDSELVKDDFLKSCGPLSFRWTGMEPENVSLQSFLLLAKAAKWPEFLKALESCKVPAVNFGYADIYGNIGYHAAGRVPIRKGGDGSHPADGWSGSYEWTNFIPFEELPHAYNPTEHYIVSVNCLPSDPGSHQFLSSDWVEPYRFQRITELLSRIRRLNLKDHMAIQADTLSSHAQEMLPLMLPKVIEEDSLTARAMEYMRNWDRKAEANSIAATIFITWNMHLLRAVMEQEVGSKLLAAYEPWSSWSNRFLQGVLKGEITANVETGQAVQTALQASLKDLTARLGSNIENWQWGKLHQALLPHIPLNRVKYLRPFVSRSVAVGGDWSSVNFGAYVSRTPFVQRNIPGYRQVVDLSQLDGSFFIHASGQSGHFLSKHFDDYLHDWAQVKYRPMRFERSTVQKDAQARLVLKPPAA